MTKEIKEKLEAKKEKKKLFKFQNTKTGEVVEAENNEEAKKMYKLK